MIHHLPTAMDNENTNQPQTLASTEIYRGRVFKVTKDTVHEADRTYTREVVHHQGSAVIVPVFADASVALVRQYRHPARRFLLEFPAGTLNPGEDPAAGAARELEEELGVVAARLEPLSEFYVSPGFLSEKMWLFLATELTPTQQRLEEDELVEIVRMPFPQALALITVGEVEDAKTIIGLMLAAPRVGAPLFETQYPAV
jgi:ADP-ribose diphosphatase